MIFYNIEVKKFEDGVDAAEYVRRVNCQEQKLRDLADDDEYLGPIRSNLINIKQDREWVFHITTETLSMLEVDDRFREEAFRQDPEQMLRGLGKPPSLLP